MDVTVLMLSSTGAKAVLAIRSHIIQNTAPVIKEPGITISGFDVPRHALAINGTAIPTKEIGPAKAVTQADRILDNRINCTRNSRTLTPRFCA